MSEYLRRCWSRSKVFRVVLVVAVVYAVLRLAVHGAYLAMMLYPNAGIMGGTPEWTGGEGEPMVPADLQIYIDATRRLQNRQDLYPTSDKIEVFQYSPFYAWAFSPFLLLSPPDIAITHTLLHILAYVLLYVSWARIFQKRGLEGGYVALVFFLPIWLVFSAFWSDLGYLNIYIIAALLGTLFIEAVLDEHLGWSLFWISIILQTKPHWAFAVAVPLLMGQYRFFLKLLGGAVVIYLAVMVMIMLIVGPSYVWQQYGDYIQFLSQMPSNFPWRGPSSDFLGYNHSIKQIVAYLLGVRPSAMRLATGIKLLLLVPLSVVSLRHLFHPIDRPGHEVPQLSLDLAFVLYLGAFIWLDMVWELSLGIAIFTYLLATLKRRGAKVLVWVVFLPYALVDFWQLVSFAIFGMDVVAPGLYILTDPSIYIPMVMIVILMFYALLIKRLWEAIPARQATKLVNS